MRSSILIVSQGIYKAIVLVTNDYHLVTENKETYGSKALLST